MGVITSQQINQYYENYSNTDIIFSREILEILRVDPRQIYLKCNGDQWACIINSVSLQSAKIIIGTKGGAYVAIQKSNTPVSIRFYFIDSYGKPMILFVNARVVEIKPYMDSTNLAIASLEFTGKPPDDLIVLLGSLLDAKTNYLRRSEERILISPESMNRLNLQKKETLVYIDQVPRNCILRDISFRGAKVLMMGIPQFLKEKKTSLRLTFEDPYEVFNINGQVVHVENIEGRKDLVSFAMKFNEEEIPLQYKMRINAYLVSYHKKMLDNQAKFAVENSYTRDSEKSE